MSEPGDPTTAPDPNQEPQPLAQIQPQRMAVRLPQRQPFVVYLLLGLTIFVFLLQMLTESGRFGRCPFFNETDLPACYGLKVNELILDGQWWRLITPVFLHASLLHIGFNMYALYVLGPELERHFGHLPFLALYLLSGFAGVVLSFLLTQSPSLGASTAIFGLLAAQGVFVYLNQKLFGRRAQAILRSIINIAIINLLIGLTPGIDNWGHVGGLFGGGLFALLAVPVYRIEGDELEFHLVNRRPQNRIWIASLVVAIIFGGMAITKFVL
ncbi:MAG: rhomboid family intramembrane serine protease [Chloroflexi bacterium]|nr:rhomboid family intramembrane serine protease [Chloroflexota bacterium]